MGFDSINSSVIWLLHLDLVLLHRYSLCHSLVMLYWHSSDSSVLLYWTLCSSIYFSCVAPLAWPCINPCAFLGNSTGREGALAAWLTLRQEEGMGRCRKDRRGRESWVRTSRASEEGRDHPSDRPLCQPSVMASAPLLNQGKAVLQLRVAAVREEAMGNAGTGSEATGASLESLPARGQTQLSPALRAEGQSRGEELAEWRSHPKLLSTHRPAGARPEFEPSIPTS